MYYPKLQHNESIDQSKYGVVFGKVVKMAKDISKCKDIISFVKMIGYLKTLKMGIDDPTFKLNLDDPFAESWLNDLLTEGFINQSSVNIRNYYEGTIEKAAHAIMKQDLINNWKVDPSTFIPDHFKNIDKKYGLKEILRKCIEFNIKNNGSFKSKSQTEMIEIKEDCLFLLYSETIIIYPPFSLKVNFLVK